MIIAGKTSLKSRLLKTCRKNRSKLVTDLIFTPRYAPNKEMTSEYLIKLFSNTEEEIKQILVDQGLIRGVGEAYADEILWYAEISPFSIASKIPLDKVKILHKTIKYVLLDAIKQTRKVTDLIFDKTDSDLLMIHNPSKKNSPTGKTINVKTQHKRTTYYTDEQIRYK